MTTIEEYRKILEKDPSDTRAFVKLCDLAKKDNDYEYLAQLILFRTQVIEDKQEIADLFFQAGETYLEKTDEFAKGVQALLDGFAYDPAHAGIGDQLTSIYAEAEDWPAALQISEQRLDAITQSDSSGTKRVIRSDLHQQAGEIYERAMTDEEKAISHYHKAIELDSSNVMAIYAAREIHLKNGNFKKAAKLCELEARAEKDKKRKSALYRELAHLLLSKLEKPNQAVVSLKRALKTDPESKDIKMDLARAISSTNLTEKNVKEHKWASAILYKLAKDAGPSESLKYVRLSILAYPENKKAMDLLDKKSSEMASGDELADVYIQIIDSMDEIEKQEPYIRKLVKVYIDNIGTPEEALKWMNKLLPLGKEEDKELIEHLSKGVEVRTSQVPSSFEPEEPFGVDIPSIIPDAPLEEDIEAEDSQPETIESQQEPELELEPEPEPDKLPDDEKAKDETPLETPAKREKLEVITPDGLSNEEFVKQLHTAAAKARRSGDDAAAEERMLQIMEVTPDDRKATTYLERRFRAREDWMSLRELLIRSAQSDNLPLAVKTVRLREAARVSEEMLSDVDGAIEAWKKIIENDSKVRDASDALTRLLTLAERWDELLETLSSEAQTTKSRSKKAKAYQRIAEVNKIRLNDTAAAIDAYNKVLELDKENEEVLGALDEIFLREQRYEDMVALLETRAGITHDKKERRSYMIRAAVTLHERLDKPDEAYSVAKKILSFSQNDSEVLELMENIDTEQERWSGLMDVLSMRVNAAQSDEDKLVFLKKKAETALLHLDKLQAASEFEAVLEISPEDTWAIDSMIEIYGELENWEELVKYLGLRSDTIEEQNDKADIHKRIAAVLEKLERFDEAMESWKIVLDAGEDEDSLAALSRYYERIEDWSELEVVLDRQAAWMEDLSERAQLLFKRATILDEKLGQGEDAANCFEKIISEVDAAHSPSLAKLCDYYVEEKDFEKASDILEQQIQYSQDSDEKKELYAKLGLWSRDELEEFERAMEAYENAVKIDSDDVENINALEDIYLRLSDWEKLLKLLYNRFQVVEDEDEKFDYIFKGAKICEEEEKDLPRAWSWYRQAFDTLGHMDDVLPKVEEAARRMDMFNQLIDVYAALTKSEAQAEEQAQWWSKIADVFEEDLNDHQKALEAVLRAFGLVPESIEYLDKVDDLAVKSDAWDRLFTVYNVLVKRKEDNEDKVPLMLRHAKVLNDNAKETSMAFDVALKAFELDPLNSELLATVEEYGLASERYEDLIRVYNVCAKMTDDRSWAASLKMKVAECTRDQLDDPQGALEVTLEILFLDPLSEELRENVWSAVQVLEDDAVTSESGMYWNQLVESYQKVIGSFKKEPEKQIEIYLLISRVYSEKLEDTQMAFSTLKDAHGSSPTDEKLINIIEEMAEENDILDTLVEHYSDILDETFEMEVAKLIHYRKAKILSEKLDKKDEAAEHYWQILQLDKDNTEAYDKLVSYYEETEQWNELVNMLERRLDTASDAEEKQKILLQIAGIWENDIKNRYEARDWYEQVVTIWPDNEAAKEGIERLSASKSEDDEDDEDDEDINELISIAPPPPEESDEESDDEDSDDEESDEESDEDSDEESDEESEDEESDDESDEESEDEESEDEESDDESDEESDEEDSDDEPEDEESDDEESDDEESDDESDEESDEESNEDDVPELDEDEDLEELDLDDAEISLDDDDDDEIELPELGDDDIIESEDDEKN